MKKLFSASLPGLCLFAGLAGARAQQFQVKWADPIETPKIHFLQHLSSPDANSFYTVHYSRSQEEAKIRTYDRDLKQTAESGLKSGLQGHVYTYFSFAGKGDVFHLMSESGKDREMMSVMPHSNQSAITSGNQPAPAAPFKLSDWYLSYRNYVSNNRKFVLVYDTRLLRAEKQTAYAYKVFRSEDGSLLHQGSFEFRTLKDIMETFHLDDQGNVYFIVKKGVGFRPRDRDSIPAIDLLVFNSAGEKSIHPINPLFMTSPAIDVVNTEGAVYINALLYLKTKEDTLGTTSLLLLHRFDPSSMKLDEMFSHQVKNLFPAGKLKQGDRLPYKIKSVHEKSNGHLVFTAEQVKQFISNTGGASFSQHFDMAAIEISPGVKETKTWRIPKFQFSGDGNHSFVATLLNDQLYLLYSDRLTNTSILDDREVEYTASRDNRNGLFSIIIRNSGEAEKKLVYAYGEKNSAPLMSKSHEVRPGQVMLAGQNTVGVLRISE